MALKITKNNGEKKLNSTSSDVNKKYIISPELKGNDKKNADLHNAIYNKYIKYVKKKKTMSDAYFKSTLTCVYDDIFKKHLVWSNIPKNIEIQESINSILTDISFTRVYHILEYYTKDGENQVIQSKDIGDIVAMFYSTLYFFIKKGL
jgi:hypothetical protein